MRLTAGLQLADNWFCKIGADEGEERGKDTDGKTLRRRHKAGKRRDIRARRAGRVTNNERQWRIGRMRE